MEPAYNSLKKYINVSVNENNVTVKPDSDQRAVVRIPESGKVRTASLDGSELFSCFTADIIKEDTLFTR